LNVELSYGRYKSHHITPFLRSVYILLNTFPCYFLYEVRWFVKSCLISEIKKVYSAENYSIFFSGWCTLPISRHFYVLKGLSHETFRPVFWPVWIHLGPNVNRLWFFLFKRGFFNFRQLFYVLMRFKPNLLGDSTNLREGLTTKDMLMLLKNILGELRNKLSIILGDSTNIREVLTPFAAFLGGPLTQNKEKWENRGLSCQSFSEIRRISANV
jgi:hypothetical protein